MILRKLKLEEHILTEPLWERIFHEDSDSFLDYYYKNKATENDIYVIEMDGEIRSMLHLNPYVFQLGEKEVPSRYIVAVATDAYYRGRGYMAELLKKSVRDMYVQKIPFAYLMPAAEAIYYPHHFRYMYQADVWKLRKIKSKHSHQGVKIRQAEPADCKKIAPFAQEILERTYNVYAKRDWIYYEKILREQKSMGGGILLAEKEGELCGMFLYEEENQKLTVREPLFREGWEQVFEEAGMVLEKETKKPMIMARLIHVEEFLSCMRCKEEVSFSFILIDPIIKENQKLFIVKGNSEHIVVRTKPWIRGKADEVQMISVDALTSILFGYKSLEQIEEEEQEIFSKEFKEAVSKLVPLNAVFINEIV